MFTWSRRNPRIYRRRILLEQLEERVVLDAAVAATPQDKPDQHTDQPAAGGDQAQLGAPAEAQAAEAPAEAAGGASQPADALGKVYAQELNVVLISNALGEVEAISKAAAPDAKVIVYDAQHDNLATIEQKLGEVVASSGQRIDHLAILSHGESRVLKLGPTSFFTAESVQANPGLWSTLGTLLSQNARIDLYGCSIGEGAQGIALVQAIAQATSVTVWASNDMTGNISGADWDLEVKTAESSLGSLIDPALIHADGLYLSSAPVADSQTVTVNEDGTLTITVGGSDADDPPVGTVWFEVTDSVDHGSLTPLGSVVKTSAGHYSQQFRYTPTPDYNDADSFQFVLKTASDPVWQGFESPGWTVVSGSISATSVVLRDMNNDGNLDIVAGVYGSYGRVALGNGIGGWWGFPSESTFGSDIDHTTSIAPAYQNGYLYLFQGRYDQEGRIFLVGTEGQVSPAVGIFGSSLDHTESIALGDVNSDGKLDIIQGNYDQPTKVYQGNGAAVFTQVLGSGFGSHYTRSVALGDVNGDGNLDVIQGNDGQASEVYLGNGNGTFTQQAGSGLGSDNTRSIALADVTGDGILDVIAGNYGQPIKVYPGHGDGTFGAAAWSSGTNDNTTCIALGDVNNDGKLDIVAGTYQNVVNGWRDNVYLGNGNGTFGFACSFGLASYTISIALGDVNNDGLLDVVHGDQSQLIRNPMNLGFSYTNVDTSAPATVGITVTAVNDPPTDITVSGSSVAENQPIDSVVGTFSTTDPDTTDSHVYTLVSGSGSDDNGSFTITGNQLKTAASFDYETKNSYSIRVKTTDSGGLWYEEAFTITVSNVNETPTVTSLAAASVPENTAGTVYTATGTDPDAGDTITWSLVGTDAGLFNIDGATGAVSFMTAPDFEHPADANHDNVYQITVIATDTGSLTGSMGVSITVTNVNDPPTVTSLVAASVPENTAGTVYTATGTDPDAGDSFTWSLSGTDAGLFNINAATGAVSFKAAPDYETPLDANLDNIYLITVIATDTGFLTGSMGVEITVTNVNEAPELDNSGAPTLTAIAEDDTGNVGNTIAAILATGAGGNPVTDVDNGAVEGIAVIGRTITHGTWQFSTNGGATWTDFGAVSVTNATLLADNADTRVRFVPSADWNGTVDPGITFEAWDQTGGYGNGQAGVDVSTNGGITPFSAATETAAITVTRVNDAPVVVVPADQVMNEDTKIVVHGIVAQDIDAAEGADRLQVTLSVDHGVITLAGTAGIVFAPGDANGTAHMTFSGLTAAVNAALTDLRYTPTPNFSGTDLITVTVDDLGNTGAPGALTANEKISITVIDVPEPVLDLAEPGGNPLNYEPFRLETPPLSGGLFGTSPVDIGQQPFGSFPPLIFTAGATGRPPAHGPLGQGGEIEGVFHSGEGENWGETMGQGATGHGAPTDHIPGDLTGLHGYREGIEAGKRLVFNLDEVHFTDLCTDCVMTASGPSQFIGLPGFYEGIKVGRALVFNLSEITCLDLCSG